MSEEKQTEKKIEEKMEKKIPSSPETKTEKQKEKAAEKVAEEVVEDLKDVKKLNDYKESKENKEAVAKEEIKVEKKESKLEDKVEKKDDKKKLKKEEKPKVKKESAVAYGRSLHISKKQGMYICSFIKNKDIDSAISDLEEVQMYKKAVPFKGEIPHRKGKGMMSGRYPIKATELFVNILKSLKGNSIVNGLDLDKTIIYSASANWASRPVRRGNRQAKRTHIVLEAREKKGRKL